MAKSNRSRSVDDKIQTDGWLICSTPDCGRFFPVYHTECYIDVWLFLQRFSITSTIGPLYCAIYTYHSHTHVPRIHHLDNGNIWIQNKQYEKERKHRYGRVCGASSPHSPVRYEFRLLGNDRASERLHGRTQWVEQKYAIKRVNYALTDRMEVANGNAIRDERPHNENSGWKIAECSELASAQIFSHSSCIWRIRIAFTWTFWTLFNVFLFVIRTTFWPTFFFAFHSSLYQAAAVAPNVRRR